MGWKMLGVRGSTVGAAPLLVAGGMRCVALAVASGVGFGTEGCDRCRMIRHNPVAGMAVGTKWTRAKVTTNLAPLTMCVICGLGANHQGRKVEELNC